MTRGRIVHGLDEEFFERVVAERLSDHDVDALGLDNLGRAHGNEFDVAQLVQLDEALGQRTDLGEFVGDDFARTELGGDHRENAAAGTDIGDNRLTLADDLRERALECRETPGVRDELVAWERLGRGLHFGPASVMSLNNAYVRAFPRAELLDGGRTAVTWDKLDFRVRNRFARKGAGEWQIREPVTVHGLAVWWSAELVPGVVLSTSPLAAPTHWEQLFLPALEPIALKTGETLVAQVRSHSSEEGGTDLAWGFRVKTAKRKQRLSQDLSLEKGFLP